MSCQWTVNIVVNKYDDNRGAKKNKNRRNSFNEEISSHKLKDLKQESGLSNMFTEGSMLDYYDLTTARGKKNKKKNVNEEERNKFAKFMQLTRSKNLKFERLIDELEELDDVQQVSTDMELPDDYEA